MAGIKGMGQPEDVKSPVPGASEQSAFDAYMASSKPATMEAAPSQESQSQFDSYMSQGSDGAPAFDPTTGYNGPGSSVLEMSANVAPFVGGLAGGIAGTGASVPGMIAMGMTGAAAGNAYKQFIMQAVLKRKPVQSFTENVQSNNEAAADGGIGALSGLGLSKAGQVLAKSKIGQWASEEVGTLLQKPLENVKQSIDVLRDKIAEPMMKVLVNKVTPLTSQESGDIIKQTFSQDIKQRFGNFVKSYGELDQVARDIPLQGAVRENAKTGAIKITNSPVTKLTDAMREESTDFGNNTYKTIKGFADRFDQSTNGQDYYKVLGDLQKAASKASEDAVKYNSNVIRDHAAALRMMADKAESYMENDIIGGMAKRISQGKASMAEMEGFQRMMAAQQNPTVPAQAKNIQQYMKSVADDYLKSRDTVNAEYAQFRGLLDDIGVSTKVKAQGSGPMQFLNKLQEVPSQQLVERMYQPKNAEALKTLQSKYPQVYDSIIKNRMSDIVAKNTALDGTVNLKGIVQAIESSPDDVINHLASPLERKTMLEVVNHPQLKELDDYYQHMANSMIAKLSRIGTQIKMTPQVASKAAPMPGKAVQAITQPVGTVLSSPLLNAFGAGEKK